MLIKAAIKSTSIMEYEIIESTKITRLCQIDLNHVSWNMPLRQSR